MDNQTNGKSLASLILGIVSLLFIFFGTFSLLGMILSIIGLVLGTNAKKEAPSSMATAGVILNTISLAVCALSFIACAICLGSFASLA